MRTHLKGWRIGAMSAVMLGGILSTAATAAEIDVIQAGPRKAVIRRAGGYLLPPMIGGFALGAATYTYRSRAYPLYVYDYWLRDCAPVPTIVAYTNSGRPIVRLVGACPSLAETIVQP